MSLILSGNRFTRVRAVVGQGDVNEAEEIEPDGLTIQDRRVVADDPVLLELTQTFLQAGPGQVQAACQLCGRHPGVLLQVDQKLSVEAVELRPGVSIARAFMCQ